MSDRVTYSVIIPVYNRRDEVRELLVSLLSQDGGPRQDVEVVLVEDGSTEPCRDVADEYRERGLNVAYYYKENEGRSPARNYGIERSHGRWLLFFDSDCVIPPGYFSTLDTLVAERPCDCFGGPDAAASDFNTIQKAISFAMTSLLTTGGIRGRRNVASSFVPRTFNMGFRREVYDRVGGFREMFSEDIDMSTRIKDAGYSIRLYDTLPVYHKRRVNFAKFFRQVHVFGMSRITLQQIYPGSMKIVHMLPAAFVIGLVAMIVLAATVTWLWLLPLIVYVAALLILAVIDTKSLTVALLAVPASFVQLCGYGTGFIRAVFTTYILGRGRQLDKEVAMRRGK